MSRRRIDVHAHYFGGVMGNWVKRVDLVPSGGYQMDMRWSPESTIEFMDRHEIATQILCTPMTFSGRVPGASYGGQSEGSAAGRRLARELNEDYAVLINDHPGRFGAFAAVPIDTAEGASNADYALAEIGYALDVLGLDGIALTSNGDGTYFGQPFYEPILAELARRRVPVFVHPQDPPHGDELSFGRPNSVFEFPVDTARAVTNAIYTGVFQRYPELTLILAHCGGVLPTLGWRIAEHTRMGRGPSNLGRGPDDVDIDPDHVTEVLHGLYYETALAGGRHSLAPTLAVTGSDHILFGTDWPAPPELTVAHNITNLVTFEGFNEADLASVDRGNAVRLFPRLG